ncbi:MAG: branched-chain amino acid ABC transporter permease [Acetivibrionales bacterium]
MFISVIMSALLSGSIYGLIGLGYSLIYRASGIMNLSQGDLMCIGGFLGYTFYKMSGLPVLPSLILTIICTFILGCILERSVIRPIFNRSANTSVIILATIAVSYIIQSMEIIIWGAAPLAIPSYLKTQTVKLFGVTYQTESLLCIVVAIICMLGIHLFMKKTPFGIAMRAAAMDPEAARSCGINVEMTTRITWAISTTIAGIAGFMIGPIYGVSTTLGPSMSSKVLRVLLLVATAICTEQYLVEASLPHSNHFQLDIYLPHLNSLLPISQCYLSWWLSHAA